MKKVLITGANGFVGYNMARWLIINDFEVIATGKGPCRLSLPSDLFHYQTLDFTNDAEVKNLLTEYKPQVILHCGARSGVDHCELNKDDAFTTNVKGTEVLLKHALPIKSFFVFLSSSFVFEGIKGMYKEEDARKPVNYYGTTKMLAEDLVMDYPFQWAIVRTVLVYGKAIPGRQNFLTRSAQSIENSMPLKIFNDQLRTPTFIGDLVHATGRIIQTGANGIFHVSGKDVLTPYEMVLQMSDYLKLDSSLVQPVTRHDLKEPALRPLDNSFDISKPVSRLNYQPLSFKEGLKKTFE